MRCFLLSLLSLFLIPPCLCHGGVAGDAHVRMDEAPQDSVRLMAVLMASVSEGELISMSKWEILYGDFDQDLQSELFVGTVDQERNCSAAYLVRGEHLTVLDPLHISTAPSKVEVFCLSDSASILSHQSAVVQGQSYSTNHLLSRGEVRDMGQTPSLTRDYVGLAYMISSPGSEKETETASDSPRHLYYVFFDGQKLREYEGEEISTHEFTFFAGGMKLIYGIMETGVRIGDIFYRSNATVDVNCYRETANGRDCFYSTYQIIGGVPYIVFDEYGEVVHPGSKLRVSGVFQ